MVKRFSSALLGAVVLIGSVFPCAGFAQEVSGSQEEPVLYPEVPGDEELARQIRLNWRIQGIDAAVRNGFIGVADVLTGQLLEEPLQDPGLRERLLNQRLMVSLVEGDLDRARQTLTLLEGEGFTVRPLLRAMFLFFEGNPGAASEVLDELDRSMLPPSSRAWSELLGALILSQRDAGEAANEAFLRAEAAAPTVLLRDHFELIRIRESLYSGSYDEETVSALRESVRSMRRERGGFEAARLLAVALFRLGDQAGAIEVLSAHLALPGLSEYGLRPVFLLLLGMIADPESPRGQLALLQLVSEGEGGVNLAVAFSLLAQTVGSSLQKETFLAEINNWLEAPESHPLADRMLAHKAYLLLEQGELEGAESSASELLERFPNSSFIPTALRLLAHISWSQEPPRYRTAADYLNRLRNTLPPGNQALQMGILIADCYFLNEDYTSASDAYGAVFAEAPPGMAGDVFFQRVLSELGAERSGQAARLIDPAYENPHLGAEVIWKAEWNLIDHLRRREQTDAALARVRAVLQRSGEAGSVPATLRLRMEWIAARLTFEVGKPETAVEMVDALLQRLETSVYAAVGEDLLSEMESHLLLLSGEALFALGQNSAALETFAGLRERFPQSGPAILSYLVESRAETAEDNLVSAQQSLINLVDRFPESEYAPVALWEAALNAEQRGLADQLQEAISILERLVTEYPGHGLVYYARLKQGDLARQLNDFPTALLLYERLLTLYPDHPERYRAALSRADCLMALGSEDPVRYDAAAVVYERFCLLPGTPLPVRLEAGYKWAHSLRQQNDQEASESVLWLLYERFILDPDRNQPILAEEAGRYWMSRVLLDLGSLQADKGRIASAIRVYETIPRLNLPGTALAGAKLEDLR